jgi:hypothetical protein
MPCTQASLFIWALLGNVEVVRLPVHVGEMNSICEYIFNSEFIQVLSLSEALAALRYAYLRSFFLDPEDNRKLSIEAI